MKDCLERKTFRSFDDAAGFCEWMREETNNRYLTPFQCGRCDLWHVAAGKIKSEEAQRKLTRQRCLTDRDLHLQISRVLGKPLEEIQCQYDLSEVKVSGGTGIWGYGFQFLHFD